MAKRAPQNEAPFRPLLDMSVISAVAKPADIDGAAASGTKIVDLPRPETSRKIDEEEGRALDAKISTNNRPVEPASAHTPRSRESASSPEFVEKFDQEKRMLLTRSESGALERLVSSLASRLNTQVKQSHILRALVTLVLNAEREIDKRAGEAGSLVRPPNGDSKALQRFEREIAKIIADGLRDAGSLR